MKRRAVKSPKWTPNDIDDIRNRLEIIYAVAATVSVALRDASTGHAVEFATTIRSAVLDPLFDVLEKFDVLLLEHDSKMTP